MLPALGAAATGLVVGLAVRNWPALPALALIGVAMVVVYVPLIRWQSRAAWSELVGMLGGMLGGALRRVRRSPAPQNRPNPVP